MTRRKRQPIRSSQLVFATAAVALTCAALPAHATDPTPLQAVEKAYTAGDFKACYQKAREATGNSGATSKDPSAEASHDLLFFKARCAAKLNHVDASWHTFQKIHPAKLDARFQDAFVTEYEAAEKAYKKDKQTEADVAALVAKQAREDANKRKRNLLIAGGVGLLGGGALLYLGLDASSEADELDVTIPAQKTEQEDLRSTATLFQATGIGLAAIGAGLCIWALVDDGPTKTAWSLQPTLNPRGDGAGAVFITRF